MNVNLCKPQDLKTGDLIMSFGVVREIIKVIPASQMRKPKISLYEKIWDKILFTTGYPIYDDSCSAVYIKVPGENAYEREPYIIDNNETLLVIEKV